MLASDIQVQLRPVQVELKNICNEALSLRSDILQERTAAEGLAEIETEAKILRRLEQSNEWKLVPKHASVYCRNI